MSKLLVIGTIIVFSVFCAVLAPWQNWEFSVFSLLGIDPPEEFAVLQVSSLEGEIEILIDGETYGTVGPEGSPFIIEDIKPGQQSVRLIRRASEDARFIEFERLLNFSSDIDTVVAYELGPNQEFSEGHIITAYRDFLNPNLTTITVDTQPAQARVILNGNEIGRAPITGYEIDTSTVNRLRFELQGYEPLEINLLPEDDGDRVRLLGYEIQIEANLFMIPITIREDLGTE